jgi:hypothetical protein
MLKGAADGGLCSAYGAGIGVGNGDAGGSDGDVFSGGGGDVFSGGGGDVFSGGGGDVFSGGGGDVFSGCDGDVFSGCEGKLPDATPVTFMCVPLTRAGFSGQDILAAILFCPGSTTA